MEHNKKKQKGKKEIRWPSKTVGVPCGSCFVLIHVQYVSANDQLMLDKVYT